MMHHTFKYAAFALATLGSLATGQTRTPVVPANSIELVLKPLRDATGSVTTLDVTVRLADAVPNQAFAVRAPLTVFSHTGIADRLHDLRMIHGFPANAAQHVAAAILRGDRKREQREN